MPDLTDSDSDVPKKKPVKEDDVKPEVKKSEVDTEKAGATFTSDDEDDWNTVVKETKESVKSFDDLFDDVKDSDKSDNKVKKDNDETKENNDEEAKQSDNEDEKKTSTKSASDSD